MTVDPSTSRLVFVHTLPPGDLPAGTVVALTGRALLECQERRLAPTVIDDHIERRPLVLDGRVEDLRWQLGWFDRLSAVGPASAEALQTCRHLLHIPVDVVVANARLLDAVVARLAPIEIVYAGPRGASSDPWHDGHLLFAGSLGDDPVSEQLLRAIAEARGLSFTHVGTARPPDHRGSPSLLARVRARLRRWAGTHRNLRPARGRRSDPASLLLWTMGYGAGAVAVAERQRGYRVVGLRRAESTTCVLEGSLLGTRRRGPVVSTGVPAQGSASPSSLDQLLREIDGRCGVPGAGEVLRSRVEAYCTRICPTAERIAQGLMPTFRRLGVRRLAAANPWALEEMGALLAAASLEPPPHRTLVQHGDAAFPFDCWLLRDLPNFDEMACTDPTVPTSLRATAAALGLDLPVFSTDAPRLEDFRRRASTRSPSRGTAPRTICYVPTGFQGENNQLCGAGFDDAWYTRWQQRLLEVMLARTDVRFVWKAAPAGLQIDPDPLRERVSGLAASHIRYTSAPFRDVVGSVDRVFLDFASTALFEAVTVGVTTICVSFRSNEDLRPEACALLGSSLRPVDDEVEGLRAFGQLIDS